MDTTAAVTLVIAAVGAVLGIINTWHQIDRSRVKLKVVPKLAAIVDEAGTIHRTKSAVNAAEGTPCIEVINLSAFPVTVKEVGYTWRGKRKRRFAVHMPQLTDDGSWPRRLEPRASVDTYVALPQKLAGRVGKAYAATECGHQAYGTSPALKSLREWGEKPKST
jgi:hypothetical protein